MSPLIAFERFGTTEKTQIGGLLVLGINMEPTSQSSSNIRKSLKPKKVKPSEEWVDDRAQDLIVTFYVGKSYDHRSHNHNQLWMAVTTGLVAAARIYAKHGTIYKDISYENLLIAERLTFTKCYNRWAGLIGFDMAKQDSAADNTTVDEGKFPDQINTLSYLAITLLDTGIWLKRHLI